MVTAINDNAEVSTYTNSDGEFLLSGVPDGNYTVTIQPDVALEIPPTVFNNVTVIKGEVTALRSEERRVGKECRCRRVTCHRKKKSCNLKIYKWIKCFR